MNSFIRLLSTCLLFSIVLTACIFTPSKYSQDMKACLDKSATCTEYVACRKEVAKRNSETFDGVCAMKDGGSDAQ